MREPRLYDQVAGEGKPFSSLTCVVLAEVAAGQILLNPENGDGDLDFAVRYAAILLKERT